MSRPVYVLRNVFATTPARFLGSDFIINSGLVQFGNAMKFGTEKAAAKFLKDNSEFRGYRVSREWSAAK